MRRQWKTMCPIIGCKRHTAQGFKNDERWDATQNEMWYQVAQHFHQTRLNQADPSQKQFVPEEKLRHPDTVTVEHKIQMSEKQEEEEAWEDDPVPQLPTNPADDDVTLPRRRPAVSATRREKLVQDLLRATHALVDYCEHGDRNGDQGSRSQSRSRSRAPPIGQGPPSPRNANWSWHSSPRESSPSRARWRWHRHN